MSWTNLVNVPKMLTDDKQICLCFIHAAWSQAEREGKDFDIDPASYVADLFGGIHPTQGKLLELLESKGFNSSEIKREIYDDISALGEDQLKSKNQAQEFFNLFQTQWHVLSDDVEKLINEEQQVLNYRIHNHFQKQRWNKLLPQASLYSEYIYRMKLVF